MSECDIRSSISEIEDGAMTNEEDTLIGRSLGAESLFENLDQCARVHVLVSLDCGGEFTSAKLFQLA